jgi:hypothetical protein
VANYLRYSGCPIFGPKRIAAHPLLAAVPLLLFFIAGCGSKPQDVTNDPAFGNFSSVVGTWKTKVPLRLVEIKNELYLINGDQAIQQSRELPGLPAGTEIRIEHLLFRSTFETSYLDVMGSLAVGPYSGMPVYIDGRLFKSVPSPVPPGSQDTPVGYYGVWHQPTDPKPDWIAAPDKLER